MTSASLVFKNFKQQFTKCANEVGAITGVPVPEELTPILAFPTIKGFFHTNPDVHMRALAKFTTRADLDAFSAYTKTKLAADVTDSQLEALRPVFYRLAKTIPPINA